MQYLIAEKGKREEARALILSPLQFSNPASWPWIGSPCLTSSHLSNEWLVTIEFLI
jgi:hypothetical protein